MRRLLSTNACVALSLALASCLSTDTGIDETGDTSTGSGSGEATAETSNGTTAAGVSTEPAPTSSSTTPPPTSTTSTTEDGTTEILPTECEDTPLRVATFNIQNVGFSGTDQFEGLTFTMARIGADVFCVQEVLFTEWSLLEQAAEAAGYDFVVQANGSPAIGGDISNACVARVPIGLFGSFSGEDISSDGNANDVGRDLLAIRAQVAPGCFAGVITVHLKSGGEYIDLFRRQVEVERLVQVVEAYSAERPDDPIVIAGDFNEQLDDGALGTTLSDVPSSLPDSYRLGNDIQLPLTYDPFARLGGLGFNLVDATWEDSERTETWNFVTRLDYIMYGQAEFVGAEVYNACEDNGVDDAPQGNWLPKEGDALPCGASEVTSDHLPVFADFILR